MGEVLLNIYIFLSYLTKEIFTWKYKEKIKEKTGNFHIIFIFFYRKNDFYLCFAFTFQMICVIMYDVKIAALCHFIIFNNKGESMSAKLFQKYYSRLAREGIVKSLLCGLIIGFAILFLSAAVFWFVNTDLFWVAILLFAFSTAGAAYLLYEKKFRPTTRQIARRVDELGLEERILTMTELEGDESYIAMRQREDALAALKTVNEKLLVIIVSIPLIVCTACSAIFGLGMTTVAALSSAGVIKSGKDLLAEALAEPPQTFELIYEAEAKGGYVEGELFQVLEEGQTGSPVRAVPEEGWAFLEWSDGKTDPYRIDEGVTENLTVTAKFIELTDSGDNGGNAHDDATDLPQDAGEQDGSSGSGPEAGGEYKATNQIIDGQTYYGYEYGVALEDVLGLLAQDNKMPEELKTLITNYFETIKVGGEKGEGGESTGGGEGSESGEGGESGESGEGSSN